MSDREEYKINRRFFALRKLVTKLKARCDKYPNTMDKKVMAICKKLDPTYLLTVSSQIGMTS